MASLVDQLRPLVEQWARNVTADAADARFAATQALCPVGLSSSDEESGTMRDTATFDAAGDTRWHIEYNDRGFTDEGPEAHTITGNPLLAFEWHERGIPLMIVHSVEWVPGEGVAQNIGWFTTNVTDDLWLQDLIVAAEAWSLGE